MELINERKTENSLVKIDNPTPKNQPSVEKRDISPREKIIQVVGTFEDIKRRQKMFEIMNLVNSYGDIESVSILSGSLAEGLDMMAVMKIILLFLNT